MPKTTESINRDLYDFLKSKHFEPTGINKNDNSVTPEQASGFNFSFKVNEKDRGSAHVTVDDLKNLILFYNKGAVKDISKQWSKFCIELKDWAMKKGLGFKVDPIDNLRDYISKKNYQESLNEGYYGTKNTSYSDKMPETVRLIFKHTRSLNENDKRYHYIEKIFVENSSGERFLLPTKKPSVAEAFARLIAEGGNPYDERGKHITELSEDVSKLAGFIRATRNKQFNESINGVVTQVFEQYTKLKETIRKLRTARGFNKYFESWQPTLMETEGVETLESMFKISSIDPRIQNALPVLGKFNISYKEISEVKEFEDWANNVTVIDEDLQPDQPKEVEELLDLLDDDSDELPLGPDATNVIGQLAGLLENEGLFDRLEKAARKDPNNDARPIIIGWMTEHSSSPVYSKILEKLESSEEESTPPAPEPKPEQKPAAPTALPAQAAGPQTGASLASPPPLNEYTDIDDILRLSGIKK